MDGATGHKSYLRLTAPYPYGAVSFRAVMHLINMLISALNKSFACSLYFCYFFFP